MDQCLLCGLTAIRKLFTGFKAINEVIASQPEIDCYLCLDNVVQTQKFSRNLRTLYAIDLKGGDEKAVVTATVS